MKIKFKKMQSNGNDFLITEDINILKASIERLSDRKNGIGFDQLLLLDRSGKEWQVRVFNADGSEANNCFNGLRCLASYSSEKEQLVKIYKNIFLIIKNNESSEQIATVLSRMPKGRKIDNFYYSAIEWRPLNFVDLNKEQIEKIFKILSSLEELDDVQNIFTNANLESIQT